MCYETLYEIIDEISQSGVHFIPYHIDGIVQHCSHSSALVMELLQSCTQPSITALLISACLSVYDDFKGASTVTDV